MPEIRVSPNARQVTGRVISDRMDKTVTVLVERLIKHPMYGKYIRRSSRFHVHDADNACRVGDTVTIAHTRPLSRTKSWMLVRIEERDGAEAGALPPPQDEPSKGAVASAGAVEGDAP